MAKRNAKPIDGTDVILDAVANDRQIVACSYDNGTIHVENRIVGGKKGKYDHILVRDHVGPFHESKYISWRELFDFPSLTPEKRRNAGMLGVKKGTRVAYQGTFTSDEVAETGLTKDEFIARLKKSFVSDRVGMETEVYEKEFGFDLGVVAYAVGCLEDYFPLDEVIDAYHNNGWDLNEFRSGFEEYWQMPIQELARQHLVKRDIDEDGEDIDKYAGMFSFGALYATSRIIRIAAGLMMGCPIEATINEMRREHI